MREGEQIMREDFCLLPMNSGNLNRCVDLFIETFSKEPWNDVYDSREQVVTFFENYRNNNYFLGYVLMKEEEVIALSLGERKPWINGMEYYIDQFCVSREFQGNGIGSYFLNCIESDIRKEGMNAIILMTDRGFPSERFYKKNGFTECEEIIFLTK